MELPTIRADIHSPSPLGGPDALESAASISSLSVLTVVEQAARDSLASVMVVDASGLCGWLNPGTKNLFGVEDGSALVGRLNLWEHCTVPGDPQGEALERAFRGEAVELPVFIPADSGFGQAAAPAGRGRRPGRSLRLQSPVKSPAGA